ncbi:receptor-like protein 34 [Capsicum annuum]|uniref:receptor-like protein 34 n=1 Tax=Capsicum annuum TaxID=4072 RepID=UPI001FB0E95A|nr:receptor-like protein 34 [Capsicum annuum]
MGCLFLLIVIFRLQYPLVIFSRHLCQLEQNLALQLLKLKLAIDDYASADCESNDHFPYPKTLSWNKSTDCCTWDGVTCDGVTGRITELDLSCSQLHGTIDSNSTLFQLSHLQKLNLAYNDFSPSQISIKFGWFPSLEELRFGPHTFKLLLQNLTQLRELYLTSTYISSSLPTSNFSSSLQVLNLLSTELSGNIPDGCYFSGNIPPTIGDLTKLTTLRLFPNNFSGPLPSTISNLVQLVEFEISSTNLTGNIPNIFGNSTNLKSLSLSYNLFTGLFPSSVTNLTKLESLEISNCSITGPIPSIATGFPNIILLFLADNSLSGEIPSWIFDLPSLKYLVLRGNQLTGQLKEFKYNLLEVVDVGENKLHGPIPTTFSKLMNLTTLDLSTNSLSGSLDIGIFSNCKQLRRLGLSFNNLSVFSSQKDVTLPNSIGSLYVSSCNIRELNYLRAVKNIGNLDLSNNKMYGKIPDWAWSNWQVSVSYLNLSSNFLTVIDPLHHFKELVYLDIKSNLIQGQLPAPPPNMFLFIVSNNNFTGKLPSSLCKMSSLVILDLSNNSLSGIIPKCLGSTLRSFNLRKNKLEGMLPRKLANCKALEVVDLAENLLNDTFPKWLGSLPRLQVLSLRSNGLHGRITTSRNQVLFSKLKILDLSYNDFTGNLSERFFNNLKSMIIVDRTGTGTGNPLRYIGRIQYHDSLTLAIKGKKIELVRILSIFTTIDFSNNKFKGDVPKSIGNLSSLRGLNLAHNSLIGPIPQSFGNLSVLESLDLSWNQLSGNILQQLASLKSLAVLNLS